MGKEPGSSDAATKREGEATGKTAADYAEGLTGVSKGSRAGAMPGDITPESKSEQARKRPITE